MIVGWPGLHQDDSTENRSSAAEFILQNVALRGFYVPHQLYVAGSDISESWDGNKKS